METETEQRYLVIAKWLIYRCDMGLYWDDSEALDAFYDFVADWISYVESENAQKGQNNERRD